VNDEELHRHLLVGAAALVGHQGSN